MVKSGYTFIYRGSTICVDFKVDSTLLWILTKNSYHLKLNHKKCTIYHDTKCFVYNKWKRVGLSWTVSTTSKEFRFINCFQPIFNCVLQFDRKNLHELAAELIGPHSVMISVSIRDQLLGTYQRNVKDAQRAWIKVINQLEL